MIVGQLLPVAEVARRLEVGESSVKNQYDWQR